MSVTLIGTPPDPNLPSPKEPDVDPLVVVAFALSVATVVGLHAGWEAAIDVMLAILALFTPGTDK